jgi:septal ring factor EnvC (AmiA/AmiB activator)
MTSTRRTDHSRPAANAAPKRASRAAGTPKLLIAAAAAVLLAIAVIVPLASAASPSIGQLNSELGQQRTHEHSLSSSVGSMTGLISSLDGQISLIQTREAAVRVDLANDRAALGRTQLSLARERGRLARLKARLAQARMILSRQLVSGYESSKPDLVSVMLEARGFNDLLERIDFLHRAQTQQQTIISITRTAKWQAAAAATKLAKLERSDRAIAQAALVRVRALAGMNALLASKEGALRSARAAQQAALDASRVRGNHLRSQIARIQAQQAAAARRAAARAAAQAAAQAIVQPSAPTALGPSGGWAIPYAIVLCESGGQNLPPNSAGASGYYQIIPATWRGSGGTGPAAYLASKAEQDAIAARLWNGGAGASNWVCAGIVGIH